MRRLRRRFLWESERRTVLAPFQEFTRKEVPRDTGNRPAMKRSMLAELRTLGYLRRHGRGALLDLIAPSATELVVVSAGQVAAWSVPDGELLWEVHAPIEAAAVGSGLLLTGSRQLHLWRDGQVVTTLEGHRGRLWGLALSPDGQLAASLGEDGLKVWRLDPPELLRELTAEGNTLEVDWERKLATTGQERWDLGSGVRLGSQEAEAVGEEGSVSWRGQQWSGHDDVLVARAEAPDGSWLATAAQDRFVKIWSAPDELLLALEDYQDWVACQALSPDGRLLALGLDQGAVRLVESVTGKLRQEWEEHGDSLLCLAFSPNGEWLASGSEDCLVGLTRVKKGSEVTLLDGHDAGVTCLAFSPDNRLLASGSSADEVVIWDVASGLALETLYGLEAGLETLQFGAHGVLTGLYDDGTVICWETSRYSN